MRIVILGTSEFSINAAISFKNNGYDVVAFINLKPHCRPSTTADIEGFCKEVSINYFEVEDINNPESIRFIDQQCPDYIFVSWPKLLHKKVIKLPSYACIGTHPTDLPANRGRHPLHWSLTQGLKRSQLSFFILDTDVDNGDVLLKIPFLITEKDDIFTLNAKVNELVFEGIKQLIDGPLAKFHLENKSDKGISLSDFTEKQEQKNANYWRKKSAFDITIDFRFSAKFIEKTVASFTAPFPFAIMLFDKWLLRIVMAEIVIYDKLNINIKQEYQEPGKLLLIDNKKTIIVMASDEAIKLTFDKNLPENLLCTTYIYPPLAYPLAIEKLYLEVGR